MNGAIWQAKNAYLKAVADNLKETGELRVISGDYDEDLGYPEGILLSIPDRHFNLVDCVFNAIKVTDKGAIEVHICYFDDQEEEGWMQANELSFNEMDAIIAAIQWPDTITDGEAEEYEDIYIYFEELLYDYELISRHIAIYKTLEQVQKVFDEAVAKERAQAEENGWEIGTDHNKCFEAYPEGSWGTSHVTIEWHKAKVNELAGCYV